jgi:hypothetical protein
MKQRTVQQNKAIHLYCEHLAKELNDSGYDIKKTLRQDIEVPWSMITVKELIFKTVLKAQLGKDSTTKMTTKEIDLIVNTITRYMGEKFGLEVDFPSVESQAMKELLKSKD